MKLTKKKIVEARYEVTVEEMRYKGEIYPPEWKWKNPNNKLELVPLSPGTEEWKMVENIMKKTLPSVNIKKIERVQHKTLWEYYKKNFSKLKIKIIT